MSQIGFRAVPGGSSAFPHPPSSIELRAAKAEPPVESQTPVRWNERGREKERENERERERETSSIRTLSSMNPKTRNGKLRRLILYVIRRREAPLPPRPASLREPAHACWMLILRRSLRARPDIDLPITMNKNISYRSSVIFIHMSGI